MMKKLSRKRIILLSLFFGLPFICSIFFLNWLFDPCHQKRVMPGIYQVCLIAPNSPGCISCNGEDFGYKWNRQQSCIENYVDMFAHNVKSHPSPIPIDMEMCQRCENLYSKYPFSADMKDMDYLFFIEKCTDSETVLPSDPFTTDKDSF